MCRRSASLFVACCRIAPRNGHSPCFGTRRRRTTKLAGLRASLLRSTGSFASSVGPAATRKSRRHDQRYEPGEARGAGGTQNGSSFSLTIGNDGKPPKSGFRLVRQSDRVCRAPWLSIIGCVQHFRGAIENHVFCDGAWRAVGAQWQLGCCRPLADVGDGDPGSRNRHDLSRFYVSNRPFRERAIGNGFWETECLGRLSP